MKPDILWGQMFDEKRQVMMRAINYRCMLAYLLPFLVSVILAMEPALAQSLELPLQEQPLQEFPQADRFGAGENKSAGEASTANSAERAGSANNEKIKPDLAPDLAYGAFQRGYYLTAFKYALPRARLGDPAAQTLIGELYDKGLGIKRDKKEATLWFKLAAEAGSSNAQFAYAMKLLEGKYIAKDKAMAHDLLKRSADAGHAFAQFNYGQIVIDERPTKRGYEIALGYFEKAAASGVAEANFSTAQIYATGYGINGPDEIKARQYLVKAAKKGVGNAQVELAIWLANGRGGDKDLNGALSWFRNAAFGGNVIAQNRLARMLALGLGTEVKPTEAAKWYLLARRRGHKDAMLADFFNSLAPDIRKSALGAANRWPAK